MDWSIVLSIFGTLSGVIAVIIALRKAPSEIKVNEGDAAEKISSAWSTMIDPLTARVATVEKELRETKKELCDTQNELELATDQLDTQAKLISAQDAKLIAQEAKITTQESRIAVLEHENTLLRQWAARLVVQVKQLGGIPVAMDDHTS